MPTLAVRSVGGLVLSAWSAQMASAGPIVAEPPFRGADPLMTQEIFDDVRKRMPACLWDESLWNESPDQAPGQCTARQRWGIEASFIDSLIWQYGRIGQSMVSIELGSGWGLGATVMSKLFKRVYTLTVDMSVPMVEWGPKWADNVVPLELDLYGDDDWAALLQHSKAEVVRVDAKHTYEAVIQDVLNSLRIPTVHTVWLDDYAYCDNNDPVDQPNEIVLAAMKLMEMGVLDCPDDLFLGPKPPFYYPMAKRWLTRPLVQGCYKVHGYLEGEVRMHYIFNRSHPSTWLMSPPHPDTAWDISKWVALVCYGNAQCKALSSAHLNQSKSIPIDASPLDRLPIADFEVIPGIDCGIGDGEGAARFTWRAPPPRSLWSAFGEPVNRMVDATAEWRWTFCPHSRMRSAIILDEESMTVLGKAVRYDNIRANRAYYDGHRKIKQWP